LRAIANISPSIRAISFGRQIGQRRAKDDVVPIALLATRQRRDRKRRTTLGRVLLADELAERLIGRQHFVGHRVGDRFGEALLICSRNARRKFLGRQQKRIRGDDAITLRRHFLQQEAHGHELRFHPDAQYFFGLHEGIRNLVQTRDVVLVLLHRVERHGERQIGEVQVRTVHLTHGHRIFLEVVVRDALLERPL
jgi:hypothetical protein